MRTNAGNAKFANADRSFDVLSSDAMRLRVPSNLTMQFSVTLMPESESQSRYPENGWNLRRDYHYRSASIEYFASYERSPQNNSSGESNNALTLDTQR
jgi:hypothetical protein